MEQRNENKTELKMIKMSDVQSQTVDWLWYPYIPYGKLTIIQGDPGDGKTTLILNIAARLSKGEGLDNDMKVTEPVNIIYQTVVRILGTEVVEDVVQQDIKEQKELEEQRRMEQMPKGSVLKQLEWATQKSQIENQQRKKNKTKYKGLEI